VTYELGQASEPLGFMGRSQRHVHRRPIHISAFSVMVRGSWFLLLLWHRFITSYLLHQVSDDLLVYPVR
jgi:hypothetical protein